MKAVVREQYGPPSSLELVDIKKPIIEDDEILVKVFASTVNRTDCGILRGKPFIFRFFTGLLKPNHISTGSDFAGKVVKIGKEVSDFKIGDRVFGFDDEGLGSHQEFMKISTNKAILKIPDKISFEDACASLEGFHYACNFVNKIDLKKGQEVMVNGGTGSIGSAVIQLLKYMEVEVVATCSSNNIELVKGLGAKKVIDYTKEDFTDQKTKFDFVFDAVGKSSFNKCKNIMKKNAIYISSELGKNCENIFYALKSNFIDGKKVIFPLPTKIKNSMELVFKLLERGQYKPVIDRVYTLEKTSEAFEYVEKGEKIGNVIIKIH